MTLQPTYLFSMLGIKKFLESFTLGSNPGSALASHCDIVINKSVSFSLSVTGANRTYVNILLKMS